MKDAKVIHLKFPCSLSLVLLLILTSRMLCFLVSHFVFPCTTWEPHTKIVCCFSSQEDKCVSLFFLPKQLCSTSHCLFLHFGIHDSRHEEKMMEGEEKSKHINLYMLLESWMFLVLASSHVFDIRHMASPTNYNLHACQVCR